MRVKTVLLLCVSVGIAAAAAADFRLPDPAMTPSSVFSGSYSAANAQDENYATDWASSGGGTNTYADFDFGSVVRITRFEFTDRVTSGGAQGVQNGGNADDVTGFDLIFSTDCVFDGSGETVVSLTSGPIFPGYATESYTINGGDGYDARCVRWDVTAISGGALNNGAAEFDFFTASLPADVPTASTWALLVLLGSLVAVAVVRL